MVRPKTDYKSLPDEQLIGILEQDAAQLPPGGRRESIIEAIRRLKWYKATAYPHTVKATPKDLVESIAAIPNTGCNVCGVDHSPFEDCDEVEFLLVDMGATEDDNPGE